MTDAPPPDPHRAHLESQCHLLLYISGANLIMNILTVFIAFMIAA